jgi:hypothetical protein
MTVRYHVRGQATQPEYVCPRQLTDYGAGQRCQALAGACVDALVTNQVLAALAPAAVESPRGRPSRCRPSGPSWNGSGNSDWSAPRSPWIGRGAAIGWPNRRTAWWCGNWRPTGSRAGRPAAAAGGPRPLHPHPPAALTPAQQQATTALASDIDGLWAAPTTTDADRKQLIRALVDQVTITVVATSEHVRVTIGWAGGHTTGGQTIRPRRPPGPAQLLPAAAGASPPAGRAGPPRPGHRQPAAQRRLPPGQGTPAHRDQRPHPAVAPARLSPGVHPRPHRPAARPRTRPPPVVAGRPGRRTRHAPITLHSWLRRGWVSTRQESRRPYRWIIHADPHQLAAPSQRRSRPPGWYTRRHWADSKPPAHNGSRDHAASPHI